MTDIPTKYDNSIDFSEFQDYLDKVYPSEDKSIPGSIFMDSLSPFESIVRYLVDFQNLGYSEVGRILQRERRVIWTTYKRSVDKFPGKLHISFSIKIPLKIFFDKELSIAESIVGYLRDVLRMKNVRIGELLAKDAKTVSTWYKRYQEKRHPTKYDKVAEKPLKPLLPDMMIPVSVFNSTLSPFETVTRYLVEEKGFGYADAGKALNKERRVIWATYKRASSKAPKKLDCSSEKAIPLSKLWSEKASMAELIVAYLKDDLGMRNKEIAKILGKNQRTVWTLYDRYRKR